MSSYVRFFNSVKNFNNLKIMISNTEVASSLNYPMFTEYFKIVPNEYTVKVLVAGEVVISEAVMVGEDEIITFCIVGSELNQDIFKVTDNLDHKFTDNVATMRFINLVPYDSQYDIYVNENLITEDLSYREISDFYDFPAKTSRLVVKDSFTNKDKVIQPKMSLKSKYIYSSYIVGIDRAGESLLVVNSLEGSTYIKE
ncbi:MAG: DUF4397 domain-containing protein [Lachnospirales bacterium]